MKTKVFLKIFLLYMGIAQAQTYVDVNATNSLEDGSSWANAYTSLQTALANANSSTSEIWIATGIYSPGSNRSDSFNFSIDGLSVYGGFAGTEASITERDIKSNPTILSGDVGHNDNGIVDFPNVTSASVRTDNNHQVTKISANNVTLDGLRIEDGDAIHAVNGYIQGAAIFVESTAANPTIQNCEINNNVTYFGGAIRIDNTVDSDITITNCIFNNNLSRLASGLYLVSRTGTDITISLTNNLFTNNVTKDYNSDNKGYSGSSAWIRGFNTNSNVTSTITNCTFANNSDFGTIASVTEKSTLSLSQTLGVHNTTISNSIFYNNFKSSTTEVSGISNADSAYPNQIHVYNSIDEKGFSNLNTSDLTNTNSSDPLFIDSDNNNFMLYSSSPAIDAGDNTKIPAGITTDLLSNGRIFNTTVDMGAHEYQGVLNTGRIYVNVNVSGGDNSGDSWANAKSDLQEAINNSGVNHEIWVAAGTYKPGINRADTFSFNFNYVSMYGGFSGTEVSVTERDIKANPTILSGDVNDNDNGVVDFPTYTTLRLDNNHRITTIAADNITIDGFKIENGDAINATTGYIHGSAVKVNPTAINLTIKNCQINNNVNYAGGAIDVRNSLDSDVTITNCSFYNNVGVYASSMYMEPTANINLKVNIANSLFSNNYTKDYNSNTTGYTGSCGWIRATNTGSEITSNIVNCTFAENHDSGTNTNSTERGALGLSKNQGTHNATVSNTIFYGNRGVNIGAGLPVSVAISKGSDAPANQVIIYNSIDEDGFSNIVSTNLVNTSNSNPLFTNTMYNDLTLQANSPAINAGDNSKILSGITTDLLLNNRIHNTIVDMGAYEFDSSSSLGIFDNNLLDNFSVQPNPTSGWLNISIDTTIKSVAIYNLVGQKVKDFATKQIHISNLKAGVYLLKIEDENGKIGVSKIIKK